MIFIDVLVALLVISGLFLLFGVKPSDMTTVLTKPFQHQRKRKTRIRSITGKPPGFITRQLSEAQQMLDAAGMGEQTSTYRWLAIILAMLGFAFGLIIENQLAAFILAAGLAVAPLAIIRIRTGEYFRNLQANLEIGMGLVTNSYLQSGDLVGTIQTNLHLLPSPLDDLFSRFLVETQFIDANLVRAIEQMRDRVNNRYWKDWCSVLTQCQHDRQLRFALPGIVARLGEMRRAQMEVDTTIRKHFGDYITTVLIVLGSMRRSDKDTADLKEKFSRRVLPITDESKEYFLAVQQYRQENIDRLKEFYDDRGFILTRPNGLPLDETHISRQFNLIVSNFDMPHQRFHDLRHAAATNMHQLTGDFFTIGEILGHSLKGIGNTLGFVGGLEAVTERYVDVRLERKRYVLEAYHKAVHAKDEGR